MASLFANGQSESFDAITYEKGGAILRMIEAWLGEDRFRDGIRLYMRRHKEANATADDLWAALVATDRARCGTVAPAAGLYLTGVEY